jgi:hypothetical protein
MKIIDSGTVFALECQPIAAMADQDTGPKSLLQLAEDRVARLHQRRREVHTERASRGDNTGTPGDVQTAADPIPTSIHHPDRPRNRDPQGNQARRGKQIK